MKNAQDGMGVKKIFFLVLKEIHGIFETKKPSKEQIKKYKKTEREILEKFDNLSEDKLNTKSNKNVYVRNNVMSTVIKRCRSKKKRGERKIHGFRKKLMFPEYEIAESPEFEVKSKIGNIFVNKKILEEYSVRIYQIDPFLSSMTKQK